MTYEPALYPYTLTWAEADPARHPFDPDTALAEIRGLEPAGRTPTRLEGSAADPDVIRWSYEVGSAWTTDMTRALSGRFGRWSTGWRWARDEGEIGGGPVGSWCCPRDSITPSPDETLARAAASLSEWREVLEDLAERFERFPLDGVPPEDRPQVWERATAHLITQSLDRTGAGDAWYAFARLVLVWYFSRWGMADEAVEDLVTRTLNGRFDSWITPADQVIRETAEEIAANLRAGGH